MKRTMSAATFLTALLLAYGAQADDGPMSTAWAIKGCTAVVYGFSEAEFQSGWCSGAVKADVMLFEDAHLVCPPSPPTVAPAAAARPDDSGYPNGSLTDMLSPTQRAALREHVRQCWTTEAGAPTVDGKMHVMLTVSVDGDGVARTATVADEDRGRMSDPGFRAFADRARRAVLDPRCSTLPVPKTLIAGGSGVLKFRFTP